MKLIDKVSKNVTDLIRDGIQILSFPHDYVTVEIEDIKMKLLGKTTANGYERAGILAKNSNRKIALCSCLCLTFNLK